MTIVYKINKSSKASDDIMYVLSKIYNYYTLFSKTASNLNIYNEVYGKYTTDLYYKIIKNDNSL